MKEVFQKAKYQLEHQLPFVLYRQPKSNSLQAFFMSSIEDVSTDFDQSGFCFFPFDQSQKNYFFPLKESIYKKVEIIDSELVEMNNESDTLIADNEDEKRKYFQLLAESIHLLKKGDYQKIVLSRPIRLSIEKLDAIEAFQKLLQIYHEAMVYIWYHPNEGIWVGATPETLVHYSSLNLKTMALAGTRVVQEGAEPVWRDKEREEQELVSKYIQQKLSSYSNYVKASETYNKQAGNVVHLNTDISARISKKDLQKVILDLHPTPAVCGLPTEKAKSYILQNETYEREFYAGFLGEINMHKEKSRTTSKRNQEALAIKQRRPETNLYVNLRCMKINKNECQLFVGGGVTASSNPTEEWRETQDKSQTLLKVL
jgi:isochorismate synthase